MRTIAGSMRFRVNLLPEGLKIAARYHARNKWSVLPVILAQEDKAMPRILNARQIVVSSHRLHDCKESLESEFHLMVDHAVSVGWSLDEVALAVNGLVTEEIAVPERAITLH